MFTRVRSSVTFSRSKSRYRNTPDKSKLKRPTPNVAASKSTPLVSTPRLNDRMPSNAPLEPEPIKDRLRVPKANDQKPPNDWLESATPRIAVTRAASAELALRRPSDEIPPSRSVPSMQYLSISPSNSQNAPSGRSGRSGSDTAPLTAGPPKAPNDQRTNASNKVRQKAPLPAGEQRRRPWRTAMLKAKQKWNALKSSFTFQGPISLATNANSSTSDCCSAGTTGPVTNTVSEADDTVAADNGHWPTTSRTTAPATRTKSAATVSKKSDGSFAKKRTQSARDPRTLSTPIGLCEQASCSQDTTTEGQTLFNLSERQRQQLRCTWYRIRGNGGLKFAERIFESLFEVAPYVKDIFYKAAFLAAFDNNRHGRPPSSSPSICKHQSPSITTCRDHAWITLRLLDSLILDSDEDEVRFRESTASQLRELGAQHAFLAKSAGMRADLWEMFGEAAVDIVRRYDFIRSNTDASRAWRGLFAGITDEVREGYERELRKRRCSTSSAECTSTGQ